MMVCSYPDSYIDPMPNTLPLNINCASQDRNFIVFMALLTVFNFYSREKIMHKETSIHSFYYLFIALFLSACVTINVYFPAAAAQEAARVIVDDVLQKNNKGTDNPSGTSQPERKSGADQGAAKPQSRRTSLFSSTQALTQAHRADNLIVRVQANPFQQGLIAMLNFVIPGAQAQANININTPKISAIRGDLKQQHQQLQAFFNRGNIGYDQQGLVKIRTTSGLSLKQKAALKNRLSHLNQTLRNLYREIARANGNPQWQADIQKTFAKTWVSQMQSGWYYYQNGRWIKK